MPGLKNLHPAHQTREAKGIDLLMISGTTTRNITTTKNHPNHFHKPIQGVFMMSNYLSSIRFFAYIRLFSWPLFFLSTWCCISISVDILNALDSRLPWESVFDALGLVDTLRAIIFPFLICVASYLGYRCVANEFQDSVIEVNHHFNKCMVDTIKQSRIL